MRLWSWHLSPFAGKVRVVLAEKGLEAELVEIDPRQRPARLRELNPSGRVPVLEADGTAIWESTVICEWLDEMHPQPPLWPADPARRAVGRALLRWVDDQLTSNFFRSMRKEAFGLDPSDHADVVAIMRGRLDAAWSVAERLLAATDGPWLVGGEEPTLADLAVLPLAVRLPEWRADLLPDPAEVPLVTAWMECLRQRPSAAAVSQRGERESGERGERESGGRAAATGE